jgi:hypothetical protein
MKQMALEYMGSDYDILRKNCCTFARDACLRLGVPEDDIPTWFGNLAKSGALTQDAVLATVEPLSTALSMVYEDTATNQYVCASSEPQESFETVFQGFPSQGKVIVVENPSQQV